jgi:sialidase-1
VIRGAGGTDERDWPRNGTTEKNSRFFWFLCFFGAIPIGASWPLFRAPGRALPGAPPAPPPGPEFADVFAAGRDGFPSIRIPAVVVTRAGTVLAFAEGRAVAADQAKNKMILKRSRDGGRTWGKAAVIADAGERSLNNPCAVVERASGRVLLMYQSYPAGVAERSGRLRPGHEGDSIVRTFLITSDDDGASWSPPVDLTRSTKRPEAVTTIAGGPGIGIQLRHGPHAGRILIPFNEGPYGLWNIYAVFSDDGGKTWAMGDPAPGGLIPDGKGGRASTVNEAQLVELKDGSVRFNVRRMAGTGFRKTCVSTDGGRTWSRVGDVPEQVDPRCMASVLRYTDPADGAKRRILFSGPIGCLFETDGANRVVFARFTLDWLTDGNDRLERNKE